MGPFEATYDDVLDLIRHEARKVRRYHREDFDELFAEAALHFVVAYRTFDRRIPFSQWVSYKISKGLADIVRRESRRARLLGRVPLADYEEPEKWDMDAFVDSLTDDGITAVAAAVQADGKRREMVGTLKAMGWDKGRIEAAFAEVRTALED